CARSGHYDYFDYW
nr:immunoglobulin heavy chain junction region [Mus musculus]MBK4189860.1 immunoglobulin heavy chain junction region [Mus musculus]MBK4189861.1 immunoglobulin heavy chain junction region [Mus musculus]MBK4189862.1 immunoglobulin heavy chain junction region [Mus musculus]